MDKTAIQINEFVAIIASLQAGAEQIARLKGHPDAWDARGLSIALTHLETAMLWLTNARKDSRE